MKFKDNKTGIIYDNIEKASLAFCSRAATRGFCYMADKPACPICKDKSKDETCTSFIQAYPHLAATLMDMTIIDDSAEESLDNKDIPKICKLLGVDVGEHFYLKDYSYALKIRFNGELVRIDGRPLENITNTLIDAINNSADIVKIPSLTDKEKAICKSIGAEWVTKDKDSQYVDLWSVYPKYMDVGTYQGNNHLGQLDEDLFPSVKCGQSIKVK